MLFPGDVRYENSTITAGDVKASTLVIRQVPHSAFPALYSLVITLTSVQMQYQVDTKIDIATPYRREKLDGVRWASDVKPAVYFDFEGQFHITCNALLDTESLGFLDELHLYRTHYNEDRRRHTSRHLVSYSCGMIHRDRDNYSEKGGNHAFTGRRHVLKHGYIRYHVSLTVSNATRDDQGMYTCALERANDRSYVSSWTQQGETISKPLVELFPCEEHRFNVARRVLHVMEWQETCFRCRAYGYPGARIQVTRDGRRLRSSHTMIVDYHMNVEEGGLEEVTVTLLRPTHIDGGTFECIASNEKGPSKYSFRVIINSS